MSVWICPGAVSLIGTLPVRVGAAPYELRSLAGIDSTVAHYVGDPDPAGSVAGYANVTPESTARYQVTKTTGDLFPEIAYHFVITEEGTLWQTLDIRKRAWHVGAANGRSVGVLLTGFGRLGRPSVVQVGTLAMLHVNLERYLARDLALVGHKALKATDCPGDLADVWLAEAQATIELPPTPPLWQQTSDDLHALWALGNDLVTAGQEQQARGREIQQHIISLKRITGWPD